MHVFAKIFISRKKIRLKIVYLLKNIFIVGWLVVFARTFTSFGFRFKLISVKHLVFGFATKKKYIYCY